jgi:hypothetical protein
MTPSPQSQALAARQELLTDIELANAAKNKSLAAFYNEDVRQWVTNKQQQKAGTELPPIPVPPPSWITAPHTYSEIEKLYDATFPGLPPLVDAVQTGPPVAPQFVETIPPPPPPPGSIFHVGPYMRDGEYAAMPDDNMPAGFIGRAPDGKWVQKVEEPVPFAPFYAQFYTTRISQ